MGSKPPKETTTTSKVEPWDAAKPFYETLYGEAQKAFQNTDRTPYSGALYAQPNATQTQALDLFKQAATAASTRNAAVPAAPTYSPAYGVDATRGLADDTIAGRYLYADSNPYLKGAVEAATRPLENNLLRNILPQLQDQSIAQGAYGGSGYGTAQALATSDFTQQALDIAQRAYSQNYQFERTNQLNAPQLYGQAQGLQDQSDAASRQRWQDAVTAAQVGNQLQLMPAQLLDLAGSQQQSWDQAGLAADLQRYNINQQAPWSGLGEWAQILNGGGFNSTGQTQLSPGGSGAASFLQGAAGTAALATSLFPPSSSGSGGAANWLSNLFRGSQAPAADPYGLGSVFNLWGAG